MEGTAEAALECNRLCPTKPKAQCCMPCYSPSPSPTCSGEHFETSTSLRRPSHRWPNRTMPFLVLSLRQGCGQVGRGKAGSS